MKKDSKPIQNLYQHRDVNHTCADCGLVSKNVNKSIKYNQYFCIECLKDKIIRSNS